MRPQPLALTQALQMSQPPPTYSWTNLIEQKGGCTWRGWGLVGEMRVLLDSESTPCSWDSLALSWANVSDMAKEHFLHVWF